MEIIVAAIMFGSFSILLVAGLTQNYASFQTNNIINSFQNDSRLSIAKIRKDLRRSTSDQISISKDTPATGTDQLTYHLPEVDSNNDPVISGNTVTWDTDDITLSVVNNNLIRTKNSVSDILAKNVKSITFIDINQDSSLYINEIKFTISFEVSGFHGRVHSYESTAVVSMRN